MELLVESFQFGDSDAQVVSESLETTATREQEVQMGQDITSDGMAVQKPMSCRLRALRSLSAIKGSAAGCARQSCGERLQ